MEYSKVLTRALSSFSARASSLCPGSLEQYGADVLAERTICTVVARYPGHLRVAEGMMGRRMRGHSASIGAADPCNFIYLAQPATYLNNKSDLRLQDAICERSSTH
jgi:hypothetical protein